MQDSTGNRIRNNFEREIKDGLWGYVEMPPDKIGLPVTVFLDVNAAYKYYNHPPCLYVANPYMSYHDDLIPVGISPTPEIYMKPHKLGIHRCDLFTIMNFIGNCHKDLLALANEEIDYSVFHQKLRAIREAGATIFDCNAPITGLPSDIWADNDTANVGNTYLPYKDGNFGFIIVRNDLGKYNYINNTTHSLLLCDKNNEPIWLDTANVFMQSDNGTIYAYVELNAEGYYLTTSGQLKKIPV